MKKYVIFLLLFLFHLSLLGERIAIVTAAIGADYYEATLPGILSKQRYCELYGYDFLLFTESTDLSRPHPWQKIQILQRVLADYDWVFWSDADSIIMNDEFALEDFIDEDFSLIICCDHIGHCVNSGQFLLKNCPRSFELLEAVYSKEEFIFDPWWEQAALLRVIEEERFANSFMKILPQRTMNSFYLEPGSYPHHSGSDHEGAIYRPGDFIIHFAGTRGLSKLGGLMRFYYNMSLEQA